MAKEKKNEEVTEITEEVVDAAPVEAEDEAEKEVTEETAEEANEEEVTVLPSKKQRSRKKKVETQEVKPESEWKEQVVQIRRVTKVVKGGKKLSFRAIVVVGNQKGQVGTKSNCRRKKEPYNSSYLQNNNSAPDYRTFRRRFSYVKTCISRYRYYRRRCCSFSS